MHHPNVCPPLHLHLVAPDHQQQVSSNDPAKDAGESNTRVDVNEGLEDVSNVEDETHGSEDDPGHHEALVGGPGAMDEAGSDDGAENSDDEKNTGTYLEDEKRGG